jgi:hypothetical protein
MTSLASRILSVATDHARALDLLPPGAEQARARVTAAYESSVSGLLTEWSTEVFCGAGDTHVAPDLPKALETA